VLTCPDVRVLVVLTTAVDTALGQAPACCALGLLDTPTHTHTDIESHTHCQADIETLSDDQGPDFRQIL